MKNNLKLLSFKSSIIKIGLLLSVVISTSNLFAGVETFNTRLTATQMIANFNANDPVEIGVEDDKFYQIQSGSYNFVTPSVKNRIILGVDHESTIFQSTDYKLRFEILVSYLDASSALQSFTTNLTIAYDPQSSNIYTDKNIHQFTNGHSVKAEVINVYDEKNNNNLVTIPNLPENLYLETEIEVERYYQFDPSYSNSVPTLTITSNHNITDNELILSWNHIEGAEEYDLEWTYVDDYDLNANDNVVYRSATDLPVNFKNNSTRVSLHQNNYTIPLTFEHGYLLYRVRAVGRDINDIDFVLYGDWTAPSGSIVSDYTLNTHYFKIDNITQATHEENKNWQYSATYAEEGKKKEVISYFDGSLRNRQSVTKSNTSEKTIVGETIYDHQGRGAVQVLPVPTDEAVIKYYDEFNKNLTAIPYSREDFDLDDGGNCSAGAKPMSTSSGASNYYSVNPNKNGVQAYVPDAFQFPFTQIEYTPDNTGRIRRQSGVGPDHKLQSGHETKYFYAQPSQRELDQLFGSEVGNKAHYKQNAVVDANRQLSVSYLDMQGRTIATSLAGKTPEELDELENGIAATVYVENEDLFAKNALGFSADNQPNINRDAIVFTTEKLIKTPGIYTFKYDIETEQFSDPCLKENLCFDCIYDLEIIITDECGNYVNSSDQADVNGLYPLLLPLKKTVGNIDPLNIQCDNPRISFSTTTNALDNITAHFPVVGVYTITKRLTINQEALDFYTEAYLNDENIQEGNENCFRSLESFKDEWLSNVDTSGCNITCESCLETLGTEEEFIAKGGTAASYAAAVEDCNELCDNTSLCEASYRTMLADVSPGGQYAKLKIMESGPDVGYYQAYMYPLSIFNYYNKLPKNLDTDYTEKPYWRRPVPHYRNENGDEVKIPVTDFGGGLYSVEAIQIRTDVDGSLFIYPEDFIRVDDFLGFWEASFAQSLVQYHPEYCYYEWCSQNSSIYGNATETSDDFDYRIIGLQTIDQTLESILDGGIGDADVDGYAEVNKP